MLAKTMIVTKFEYNYASNKRLLDLAMKVTPEQWADGTMQYSRGNLHTTLYHTLTVEQMWVHMCQHRGVMPALPSIDDLPSAESLQTYCDEVHKTTMAYLNDADDAELATEYGATSPSGKEYTMVVWHILTHVLYHSAQHRSEAADLLTQYGHSPGDMDFIFFVD